MTLVERTTRFTMLIHLPRGKGYGTTPRVKNGPPLAGYGAITMKNRLAEAMTTLPDQLRHSLTWDRGKELSAHPSSRSKPASRCSSPTPTVRGSAEPTRTPMARYGSTPRMIRIITSMSPSASVRDRPLGIVRRRNTVPAPKLWRRASHSLEGLESPFLLEDPCVAEYD